MANPTDSQPWLTNSARICCDNLNTRGSTTWSSTDILCAFLLQLEPQTLAHLTVEQLVRSQYEALAQKILVSPCSEKAQWSL